MPIKRRLLDVPDFSGASLEEIIKVLENISVGTKEDILSFVRMLDRAKGDTTHPEPTKNIKKYVQYWVGLLEDFQADLKRVLDEMPKGVEKRHVEILRRIGARSLHEKLNNCSDFDESVLEQLESTPLFPLANQVFDLVSQRVVDNEMLGDLAIRLETFIGDKRDQRPNARSHDMLVVLAIPPETSSGDKSDQRPNARSVESLDVPKGLSWGDITIRFLDGELVEIRAGNRRMGAKNYSALGFENKSTNRPDMIWVTLRLLANNSGEFSWQDTGRSDRTTLTLQKNISLLRKRLKTLFKISEDPFFPYHQSRSYKAKFTISANPEDA